jgi:RNA polymerase sigma-B factor
MNGDAGRGVDDHSAFTSMNLAAVVDAGPHDGGRKPSKVDSFQRTLGSMAPECEVLVLDHRRLARRLAQRYVRHGEQREDLEQVAYLGLVKAARRFDPERGVAFTTFAMPTILGELRRFCRDTRWTAHVPRAVQERVQALRRVEDAQPGRGPSTKEAAALLGWSEEEVLETRLAAAGLSPQSLDAASSPEGEAPVEALGHEDIGFERAEQRDEITRALAQLPPREQLALRLRGEVGCSTPEIARRLHCSPSQASRLIGRATMHFREVMGEPSPGARGAALEIADAGTDIVAQGSTAARRLLVEPGSIDSPHGAWLLILSGALLRSVAPTRAELGGPGDVIRGNGWEALAPSRLAVLDRGVLEALPPVALDALLGRVAQRADALAAQLAITDQRRIDDRLMSLFRMLGERWGTRTAEGVAITLPLTHETIAMLVGAHRPTVTSGLRRLERASALRRSASHRWVLRERAPLAVAA